MALVVPVMMMAQGWPANYGGVMLQGFYWDSFVDTQWNNLEAQADELAQYFDLMWVPQSGNCNSTYNVMGYTPVYWYDHNSSFGTEAALRSMIKAFSERNVGIIADVVINHRGSIGAGGSWVDFPQEIYNGVTYQLGLADICVDDDGGATAKKYAVTGAKDTGEDWNGMRDLDHTSANVQANVLAYLGFLKDDLGYAGFRYDMTKGYAPKYTGLYNSTINPTYSVGEYWDGNLALVEGWIDATKVNGTVQSAAFDFPTRYSIRDACNNTDWSKLSTKGLAGYNQYKRYAVTFVENHDTQRRSASEQGDPVKNYVLAANAYMLCTPGTPCVFLQHWKQYKDEIKQLITARKLAGINNQSSVTENQSKTTAYSAYVDDKLYIGIGSAVAVPKDGYKLVVSGDNYSVYLSSSVEAPWISVPSGSYEDVLSVNVKALSSDDNAQIVYTTDGSEPTPTSMTLADGGLITVEQTTTLKVGILSGGEVKNVTTRNYVIQPFVPHTATVYVKAEGWNKLYMYAWANDNSNTQLLGSWPGTQETSTTVLDGETWFYHSFDITDSDYSFNIIFNKGSNADQTVDIGPIDSDRYFVMSSTKTNGKYTVDDVTGTYSNIDNVITDGKILKEPLGVYSIDGRLQKKLPYFTTLKEALEGLPHGLYLVNGKKVVK